MINVCDEWQEARKREREGDEKVMSKTKSHENETN